ncbi:transcriptional regulator Rpn4p [[Candida] jaroonii]|uniref:Transcriptional regulator Rpn4p n=1 Tax=[Candida] jaroonii TaxID=467808 RepID=A0ACA9YB22_9ASCO|nr:transcriptional regulator Rpn4p [[Candida] jaroonii]
MTSIIIPKKSMNDLMDEELYKIPSNDTLFNFSSPLYQPPEDKKEKSNKEKGLKERYFFNDQKIFNDYGNPNQSFIQPNKLILNHNINEITNRFKNRKQGKLINGPPPKRSLKTLTPIGKFDDYLFNPNIEPSSSINFNFGNESYDDSIFIQPNNSTEILNDINNYLDDDLSDFDEEEEDTNDVFDDIEEDDYMDMNDDKLNHDDKMNLNELALSNDINLDLGMNDEINNLEVVNDGLNIEMDNDKYFNDLDLNFGYDNNNEDKNYLNVNMNDINYQEISDVEMDDMDMDDSFLDQSASASDSSVETPFDTEYSGEVSGQESLNRATQVKMEHIPESEDSDRKKDEHVCHLINPHTDKPCDKNFSRPYDLIRHQETIHASLKKIFRCVICEGRLNGGSGNGKSKTFSRGDALSRHIKVKHQLVGQEAVDLINNAKDNVEYVSVNS